jgi:hypothetical protein
MHLGVAGDLVEHDRHGGQQRDQAEQLGRVEVLREQGGEIADAGRIMRAKSSGAPTARHGVGELYFPHLVDV